MKHILDNITSSQLRRLAWLNMTLLQAKVYTLSAGETASSIAPKYNMATEALWKLNQFRTFSRGFDNLKPGDELDAGWQCIS